MNQNEILTLFGKRIRTVRKEQNMSQEELANASGLHRTYIGMIERGEKNITLKNILKISNALKVNLNVLLEKLDG